MNEQSTLQAVTGNVLVFHIGSLGDTAVRDNFPSARRVLLTKAGARSAIPVGREIVEGSGLFDDVLLFEGDHHSYGKDLPKWRKALVAWNLIRRLRRERFELVVYLAPSQRDAAQIARDLRFFRLCGIPRVIGAKVVAAAPAKQSGAVVPKREATFILDRLAGEGLAMPTLESARRDLALNDHDREQVQAWIATRPSDGGRRWIGIAPGSNLQSKLWPVERYEAVVAELIDRYDVWPVVFGGPEDVALGERLVNAWGRGWNTASEFAVRTSAAALSQCSLYIGNDTGTMHLAASVGVPCVAIFSARDQPGKWEPLGDGHAILRRDVPCAGCMLVKCVERERRCLTEISVGDVVAAACNALGDGSGNGLGNDARDGRGPGAAWAARIASIEVRA
jgi:heptosyltransferase-3